MARVTSPAVDLTYYLFSSIGKSLRDAHLDEFLQIYYTNLAQTVRVSGSDPDELFPKSELQRQLRQFGKFEVAFAPLMIPLILADSSEIANLDELSVAMSDDGEYAQELMANLNKAKEGEFAQRMKDALSDGRQYGWIQ